MISEKLIGKDLKETLWLNLRLSPHFLTKTRKTTETSVRRLSFRAETQSWYLKNTKQEC
jgi:hypothetical protein